MFVELIDQLRCPAAHADTWLVLFADESRDRHILRGTLGCPICGERYAIEDGTVWFDRAGGQRTGAGNRGSGVERAVPPSPVPGPRPAVPPSPVPGPPPAVPPSTVPLPPTALAAYLDLAEPGGIVALFGGWADCAEELGDILDRVELVAVAPERPVHPMVSAIVPPSRTHVPLAAGAMRAAAVDARDDADLVAQEAARLVRAGGRILAPASTRIPPGVRELTRDSRWWIGEREAGSVSGMIPLTSRRSPG